MVTQHCQLAITLAIRQTLYWIADAPSEPRDLEITKYDKSSVTLKWKAPTDDGGNPIQGKWLADCLRVQDFHRNSNVRTVKHVAIVLVGQLPCDDHLY